MIGSGGVAAAPRVVIITLDSHLAGAVARARASLRRDLPGLELELHAAVDVAADPEARARCHAAIAQADILIVTLLFLDEHIRALLPQIEARRASCDALVCALAGPEVTRLTAMGALRMDQPDSPLMAMLKKLRGKGRPEAAGAQQMAMLRRLPKILKLFPGKAKDVAAYFTVLQCWLGASDGNIDLMVRHLVARYASGPREGFGALAAASLRLTRGEERQPEVHPDIGVYHPRANPRIGADAGALPRQAGAKGRVGLLLMRSYVLGGDTAHYDAVIAALEAQGLDVVPAFASGLDQRPAIEALFMTNGAANVDALVSLTGFSLVGGPAYNDAGAAEDMLRRLDMPYVAAHALEFQSLEGWGDNGLGLAPFESTLMVAVPELDGAVSPTVFAGRSHGSGVACNGCERACVFPAVEEVSPMRPCAARIERLARRVARVVELRRTPPAERRVGIVLYNFPPNAGATGSAAYLAVFESLHTTLAAMRDAGYGVEVPGSSDALREMILGGNSAIHGTDANVHVRIPVDEHIRRERHLRALEGQWGPAPGRLLADSRGIFIQGRMFGKVFVGIQPGFGYEGDPMRLLFERDSTPTHAFTAFYRWLREDFGSHALVHFGMHGALEFMPGKQVGLSDACWPERLAGDTPNLYLYAANNPSEGAIARRRSAATLISYLTPALARSGLYKGLSELRGTLDRWRATDPANAAEIAGLVELIQDQAAAIDLADASPRWAPGDTNHPAALLARLREMEGALISDGLHVIGRPMPEGQRRETLAAIAHGRDLEPSSASLDRLIAGGDVRAAEALSGLAAGPARRALFEELSHAARELARDPEIPALLRALDGGFVPPAPGGDLARNPQVLPTGRNVTGFDPLRIPSPWASKSGAAQAERLLARHRTDNAGQWPRTVALVLWGTDNLKTEGGPIAQALHLIGAEPRFDSYGRLCGAQLVPLSVLGRPRVDVMAMPSGIFRDLLPLHMRLIADALWQAANAEEPLDLNPVRAHALAFAGALKCDMETAALRVFSHDDGAYGVHVNQLIESSAWSEDGELADQFETRTCFAHDRHGRIVKARQMMRLVMGTVDLAYQNLDSVELGITTIDHYVDMLGGVAKAVERVRGAARPVYIGDETQGAGKVRTLGEQVELESRTRTLNPRWFEGQLRHGYEGVRQIEAQVTNTLGWSATTGEVKPWVYARITETYVLDAAMRARLGALNPKASLRMVNRLIEASERAYWQPDEATLDALRAAADDYEDALEGVAASAA